jgi:uncharacterized protein (TIGR02099 family)
MLKRVLHIAWLLAVSLLLLAALVLTAVRLLVPELAAYRLDIEAAASAALGRQVSIARLEATWRDMGPVLKLKGVAISTTRGGTPQQLEIREVWVSVDVEHYLAEQELQFSGIDVIGADLTLVRDAAGRIYLDGLASDSGAAASLSGIAAMHRLSMHDSVITIHDRLSGEPARRFTDVTISISNEGYMHAITGYALLPPELGYRIDVQAELYGKGDRFQDWQGRLYLHGQSLSLEAGNVRHLPDDIAVQGVADVRLWMDINAASVTSVSGEVDARDFRMDHPGADQTYRFAADSVRGQVGWERTARGWQFAVQQFQLRQGDRAWETDNLSLASGRAGELEFLNGQAAQISMDGLGALLPVIPGLDVEQRSRLAALQPRGRVRDLQFGIERTAEEARVSWFAAHFFGLGIEQSGPFPFIAGLDGEVAGSQTAGMLRLDSHYAGIKDTRLFRGVLPIDRAQGEIRWQMNGEQLEIGSDELLVYNQDMSLQGRFAAAIPLTDAAAALNLQLDVEYADLGRVSHYLPAGIMPATGVAWLDRSLKGGVITDGSMVVNGRLDQLPFDHGEGRLEVRLPVTNAVLDYNEDWSPVTGLDAQVDFTGRVMDVRSHRGSIRTASLENVHAQIRDLARPALTIKGSVQGELPVMLAELGSSPLGETFGGFVDRVTTRGAAQLGLDILVPLSGKPAPVEVAGRITLQNNRLAVKDTDFVLEKISGQLKFDDDSIKGQQLDAHLYGRPAQVAVWTEAGATRISLAGKLGLLDQVLDPQSPLRPLVSGDSHWHVLLAIRDKPARGQQADMGLTVTSSLLGTAIDLPPPFGKRSEARRELRVRIDRLDNPVKVFRLDYGEALRALLKLAPGKQGLELQQGNISLGATEPVLPAAEELLLSGRLAAFHATDWQSRRASGNGGLRVPVKVDVVIDALEVAGHLMRDVRVQAAAAGRVWNIKADGPAVAGEVQLMNRGAGLDKVVMTLQRLILEPDPRTAATTAAEPALAAFPDLQITAQQLVYDGIDFGQFELSAQKQAGNVVAIKRLAMSSDMLSLRLTGDWKLVNGQQVSSIDLSVSEGEMDTLMTVLGYQKSIEDGKLSGSMRVAWPGPPWAYKPAAAEGKIHIKIEDGQLLDVDPGTAGRVLGLLSLNNLPRRLKLDFSDLSDEGFSFDTIEGNFVMDAGNGYTNDLYVDGPAAKIEISGRVGIASQDYDELVTVTPYLKTGITVVGALAGGPAVGAVLMVAESLLEGTYGPLNKLAQKQYSVTGPWSDPVIKRLKKDNGAAQENAAGETD